MDAQASDRSAMDTEAARSGAMEARAA